MQRNFQDDALSARRQSASLALQVLRAAAAAMVIVTPAGAWAQPASSRPAGGPACVQVQIGGETAPAYGCLNQQLQEIARTAAAPQAALPLSAGSSSNQVGSFNEQGVREQYGQNFGKSALPYRPPAPVFNTPAP